MEALEHCHLVQNYLGRPDINSEEKGKLMITYAAFFKSWDKSLRSVEPTNWCYSHFHTPR